jgi:hypothetical protein
MGQGTTPPPEVGASAASGATGATGTSGASGAAGTSALSEQQAKAIAAMLSQLGKNAPAFGGIQGQQTPRNYPQTSTVQGGTYFNPQQAR